LTNPKTVSLETQSFIKNIEEEQADLKGFLIQSYQEYLFPFIREKEIDKVKLYDYSLDMKQDESIDFLIDNKYVTIRKNDIGLSIDYYDDIDDEPILEDNLYFEDYLKLTWSVIDEDEIGTIKDNDQYFYQSGYSSSTVATFNYKGYEAQVVCVGEQRVFVDEDKDENLVPVGEGVEQIRLINEPDRFLEALTLQQKTEVEYLYYSNNCWLTVDLFDKDGTLIYKGEDEVYSSIKEAIETFSVDVEELV